MIMQQEIAQAVGEPSSSAPQQVDEAWMRYIIEFHLPHIPFEERQLILNMLQPLINLAPKTNIRRREIVMHLLEFDIIWDKYFVYMRKGKYDPKLLVVQEIFRQAIEFQLNRSVEGWLGRLMHTKLFRISTMDESRPIKKGFSLLRRKQESSGGGNE